MASATAPPRTSHSGESLEAMPPSSVKPVQRRMACKVKHSALSGVLWQDRIIEKKLQREALPRGKLLMFDVCTIERYLPLFKTFRCVSQLFSTCRKCVIPVQHNLFEDLLQRKKIAEQIYAFAQDTTGTFSQHVAKWTGKSASNCRCRKSRLSQPIAIEATRATLCSKGKFMVYNFITRNHMGPQE